MTDARRRATSAAGTTRMRDVTHVHTDHDPRAWHWFARGPTIAADGGRRGEDRKGAPAEAEPTDEPTPERDVETERIRDVSHEPKSGEGANRVWERGEDERDDEDSK